MIKVDLHTHSYASPDGALSAANYRNILRSGGLDCIAVTDHNTIDAALQLQAEFGEQIIVGEEITALEGEIIGLFLQKAVPAGLSAKETVRHVHEQGGLVYIPHPFETVRKGLPVAVLDSIADDVDIVETYNGRSLQQRGAIAAKWAQDHGKAGAASSDAHGWHGWGKTYSILAGQPDVSSLVELLAKADYHKKPGGILANLYPKFNRLRKYTKHA